MQLPNEPGGFAVNLATGEVHKRHASHALGFRRTTGAGVLALLHYEEPVLCAECFPPEPIRKGRTRFTSEPVKVVEPEPDQVSKAGVRYEFDVTGVAVESPEDDDGKD